MKIDAMTSDPASAKIVIKEQVLEDLNVLGACVLLVGLMYMLNFSYPKE